MTLLKGDVIAVHTLLWPWLRGSSKRAITGTENISWPKLSTLTIK